MMAIYPDYDCGAPIQTMDMATSQACDCSELIQTMDLFGGILVIQGTVTSCINGTWLFIKTVTVVNLPSSWTYMKAS